MLEFLLNNAGDISQGINTGNAIGQAAGGFFRNSFASKQFERNAGVERLNAEMSERRARRRNRYEQGLARVASSAAGNGQVGSIAYVMADNAYNAELDARRAVTEAELRIAAGQSSLPTTTSAFLNASGLILGATGDALSKQASKPLPPVGDV